MRWPVLLTALLFSAAAAATLWGLPVSWLGFDAQGHAVTTSLRGGVTHLEVRDPRSGQTLRATPLDNPGRGVAFSADVTAAAWVRADTLHFWRPERDVGVPAAGNGLAGTQVLALSPDGERL